MGPGLLWGLMATFALAAFTGLGRGAELREAARETEGEPAKGDVVTPSLHSTTLPLQRRRNRTRDFRTGSLSILSRTATEDLSIFLEEEERHISYPESEAASTRDPCLGCCATPLPNHPGSRENQPSKGDSGTLGNTPTTAPPRRNSTRGDLRPGAYTPMRKARKVSRLQTGSFSGTVWTHPQEASPTPDRCQGCCEVNTTASANPPGRREEGKGSSNNPISGGSLSKGAWRPVLDRKDPSRQPSQMEEDEWWSLFSGGAALPLQNHAGQ